MSTHPSIITGDFYAPAWVLTSGYWPTERREYSDGVRSIRYDHKSQDGRVAFLVWDGRAGTNAGAYWYKGSSASAAVRMFRSGHRVTAGQRQLMRNR